VKATEARLDHELQNPSRFLAIDRQGDAGRQVRQRVMSGATVVEPGLQPWQSEIDVPGGSIHHWRGYVFIPGATVDDLLVIVKDPAAHRQEDVLVAQVLDRSPGSLRLYLKLRRTGLVTVGYNTQHRVQYERIGPTTATSRSVATRIAELEDPGEPTEHEKPVGSDRGFLWRLNSYWRYQAVPGGVIVELESLTLSRDLPFGFRTGVRPIVEMVARQSVERTLRSLRARFAA
jgi:hypothetical protein